MRKIVTENNVFIDFYEGRVILFKECSICGNVFYIHSEIDYNLEICNKCEAEQLTKD